MVVTYLKDIPSRQAEVASGRKATWKLNVLDAIEAENIQAVAPISHSLTVKVRRVFLDDDKLRASLRVSGLESIVRRETSKQENFRQQQRKSMFFLFVVSLSCSPDGKNILSL